MGHVKKSHWKVYWSTDPILEMPIFPKTMSRNKFEQILTFLHFCDKSKITPDMGRIYKVKPLLDCLLSKFQSLYKPKQQLSLDEGMIPWRG
jgi:hypothetical protein